jgi:enterochelin esterase family protein
MFLSLKALTPITLCAAMALNQGCSDDAAVQPDLVHHADGAPDQLTPDASQGDLAPGDLAPGDLTPADAGPQEGSPADTGPSPDAKSCVPTLPTPNLALFTKLEADLKLLSGAAARKARVDTFFADVAKTGRYPVRDASSMVFLYRGAVSSTLSVAGSFNSWKAGADPLTKFADTELYYLKKSLGKARQEYKFSTSAGTWLKDPLNEHVIWDGIPNAGLGAFNSVIPPFGGVDPAGELRWHQVKSTQLNNTRDVFVYLPPAYLAETCKTYPVIFVNDGNESLTRSQFDQVATSTFAAKKAKPALLVFVALASQNDRMSEYSCETTSAGPKYADFLCDTLTPLIDKGYRTTAKADERGIIGASLGGLISYAAAFWRNDCFHLVGGQSGSFWFPMDSSGKDTFMMVNRVTSMAKQQIKQAYLDNGSDNRDSTLKLRDALKAKGYPVFHWENQAQKHEWSAWKDRFDEALGSLSPP